MGCLVLRTYLHFHITQSNNMILWGLLFVSYIPFSKESGAAGVPSEEWGPDVDGPVWAAGGLVRDFTDVAEVAVGYNEVTATGGSGGAISGPVGTAGDSGGASVCWGSGGATGPIGGSTGADEDSSNCPVAPCGTQPA